MSDSERDWFDTQFGEQPRAGFLLEILTHGRCYIEEYDTLEEALEAAAALDTEPRETAQCVRAARGELRLEGAALRDAIANLRS